MILLGPCCGFVMLRTRGALPTRHRGGERWQCLGSAGVAGAGACGDGG